MPAIKKSADLRNAYREPIFFTKKGEGDLSVIGIETYEELTGRGTLYNLLQEGINDIRNENILTEEEMDKELDLM
jgi:hypothetical protein